MSPQPPRGDEPEEQPARDAVPEANELDEPDEQPAPDPVPGEPEATEPEPSDASGSEVTEPEQTAPAAPPRFSRRPRRAAETTAPRPAPAPTRRRAGGEEAVIVRAQAKYVRTAPRKVRLVVDHIRGKSVEEARAILAHTTRGAAKDVLGLLNSCVANAENNHELGADELRIERAYVDEGPTLKRYRPRAQGRATRIRKRTSHMTILLTNKD